jgi:hypothetical protein
VNKGIGWESRWRGRCVLSECVWIHIERQQHPAGGGSGNPQKGPPVEVQGDGSERIVRLPRLQMLRRPLDGSSNTHIGAAAA